MTFINKFGLLNAFPLENVSENTPLFTLEYLLLKHSTLDQVRLDPMFEDLTSYVYKCWTFKPGLYNNMPIKEFAHEKDKYTSPDQLIAFALTLWILGDSANLATIWRYLWTHCFTYDNISHRTNFKRTMQPKAILTVAYAAGKCWPKVPLAGAIEQSVQKALKNGTSSGILKAWVIDKTFGFDWIEPEIVKKAFDLFFGHANQVDHPIRKHI